MFSTDVEKRIDPYGHPYYWIVGDLIDDGIEGTDVHTLHILNQPAVTPISIDMDAQVNISMVRLIIHILHQFPLFYLLYFFLYHKQCNYYL